MSVAEMKLLNIVGVNERLDTVISKCVLSNRFHPENTAKLMKGVNGLTSFEDANPYKDLLDVCLSSLSASGIEAQYIDSDVGAIEKEEIFGTVASFNSRFESLSRLRQNKVNKMSENVQVIKRLEHMTELDVYIDDLYSFKSIVCMFGRLPAYNYEKVLIYEDERNDFLFVNSSVDEDYVWGMVFATLSSSDEIMSRLESMYFKEIPISERSHLTPRQAIDKLKNDNDQLSYEIEEIDKMINEHINSNRKSLLKAYSYSKYHYDSFEIRRYFAFSGNSFCIAGWMEPEYVDSFIKEINSVDGVSCVVQEDTSDIDISPPTKLKNNALFKPFEELVCMYGLPSYNEFDPTPLFAITYTIIFGAMFGDVGQGAVLMIIGFLLWKLKKMMFGRVISTLGASSVVFGFVYGSFFGNEELLPGFKPMESADQFNLMLGMAVAIGVMLISAAIVVNIVNAIRQKDIARAVVSQNGIAGAIFYWSILIAAISFFFFKKNLFTWWYIALFIALPLLLIFLRLPVSRLLAGAKHLLPESKFGYFLESGIELFEMMLSFATNTMSFIRIGGFALGHAVMMMAVYLLAKTSGGSENIFIIIIGNIIVMVLEGMIVGIQALRLHFYELFSRFFSGEGRPFKPVKIN